MRCDWTGEPPGELIDIATACDFLIEKAFLIISSCPEKSIPCLNLPTFPITPDNFIWLTIFFFFEKWEHVWCYKTFMYL